MDGMLMIQTQQLQMQAMSNSDIVAGGTETQQLRIAAPPGVSFRPL